MDITYPLLIQEDIAQLQTAERAARDKTRTDRVRMLRFLKEGRVAGLRDPLIFYFWMPLDDLFDDIAHQMSAYRLLQPSESCREPQP